jgi:hypothetical protein
MVGMGAEISTILRRVEWGKLNDTSCPGSHLLTLEFLMTFSSFVKNTNTYVRFHRFGEPHECDLPRFSELMDFSKSCLSESAAMKNFSRHPSAVS